MSAPQEMNTTGRAASASRVRSCPFELAGWLVEPDLNRISRDDQAAQIEPKVMDVLVRLAAEPGEVVTKQQLLDSVWSGDFVTESVLSRAIAELRSQLGDDARNPTYIATIPKRGYRLIAESVPVHVDATDAPRTPTPTTTAHHAHRWRIPAIVAAVVLTTVALAIASFGGRSLASRVTSLGGPPEPPRLIVFPFENYGPDERANFAHGITEEITSQLAAVPGLNVISRTTAVNYDRTGKTVRQIAHDLDVDYILEGSVRWETRPDGSDRMRVTPQLIRVSEDAHVWSASYDRSPDELLAVQSEIGRLVVDRLDLEVAEAGGALAPPNLDLAAYEAFLDGRAHLSSDEESDYRTAIASLERAVELEPTFVRAWAELSEANGLMVHFGFDTSADRIERSRLALQRALELGPELPEVHRATGFFLYHCQRDFPNALAELEIAAKALPNDSEVLAGIAFIERRLGSWERSLAIHRRALELDPWNPSIVWNLASSLFYMRRYAEAEQVLDRAVAIAPGMRTPHFLKVNTYLWWDGTTERARQALEAVPGPHDDRWLMAAWRLEVVDGRYTRALKLVESNPVERWDGVPTSFFACICHRALDREKATERSCGDAIRLLRLDYQQQPRNLRTLTTLAQAEAIRGDPAEALRFARAAAEVGAESEDAVVAAELAIELARIDMLVGDIDGALDRLDAVLATPAPISVAVLRNSDEWAPLRAHPRFEQIVAAPKGT